MSSLGEQALCVEVAFRLLSGAQKGPKAGTREGAYVAERLSDAARTLRLVERHADEFAKIIRASEA